MKTRRRAVDANFLRGGHPFFATKLHPHSYSIGARRADSNYLRPGLPGIRWLNLQWPNGITVGSAVTKFCGSPAKYTVGKYSYPPISRRVPNMLSDMADLINSILRTSITLFQQPFLAFQFFTYVD